MVRERYGSLLRPCLLLGSCTRVSIARIISSNEVLLLVMQHGDIAFASTILWLHKNAYRRQFTRVTRGQELGAYYHPLFQRSNPQLSLEMACHQQGKTHQESEPMNPVVFGIATPAMIRHGFADIPDCPHDSKLNLLPPTGQVVTDINHVSTNEATTPSSSPPFARRPRPVITKEFEALLQQSRHQQLQSRMATPAVSASAQVISTSSSDSNISGGHHEHKLALMIQQQLQGTATASNFSSSAQADTSTSSLNSIISGGSPEHHRIRMLQQQLEALQRQLMDRQQAHQQSNLPLSFMPGIEQSNRAQNSTQIQHSIVAESSTRYTSGMAERNRCHNLQHSSDMMERMEPIGGGHANATHMFGMSYDVANLPASHGEAGDTALGQSHHLGTGGTPSANNSIFCAEGNYTWPPDIPFEVSAAHREVIGDLDPIPIATNNDYHEFPTWMPPQQQQLDQTQTRQRRRGSESVEDEELQHLTDDSHDLRKG